MGAAFKKSELAGVTESLAARSALKLARASRQAEAVPSPAREMQMALADRLNSAPETRSNATFGVLLGLVGSTLLVSLLIYAAT